MLFNSISCFCNLSYRLIVICESSYVEKNQQVTQPDRIHWLFRPLDAQILHHHDKHVGKDIYGSIPPSLLSTLTLPVFVVCELTFSYAPL